MDADVAVVGLGSMGSAALWQLAGRGVKVMGIDSFEPGHANGAGHGESKIIRSAYAEGPAYVPLIHASLPLWRRLEEETGRPLLTMTGAIMIGAPESWFLKGALESARQHDLIHRVLDPEEAQRRWPQLRLDPGERVLWEPRAGLLRPELAVIAAVERARELGATVLTGTHVDSVTDVGDHVEVRSGSTTWSVERAVLATGAWVSKLLGHLDLPFWVERQVQAWFALEDPAPFRAERMGIYIRALDDRSSWYGFPTLDGRTIKVAFHHNDGAPSDPDAVDREIHPSDIGPLEEMTLGSLRGVRPDPERAIVCIYTNTPDDHFVLGHLPGSPRVVMAGPMAGHGLKFSPVIGAIAADLVLEGRTEHDIGLFDPARLPGLAAAATAGAR
jgi:sarcosine oxidase